MTTGEIFLEVLKMVVPAGLVLGAFALFLSENRKRKEAAGRHEILRNTFAHVVPLRLQAYERLIIFMERVSPDALFLRAEVQGKSVRAIQIQLVTEIREEFNHNIAQQLYVDGDTWSEVVRAKEQVISLVNQMAKTLPADAPAVELAKRVLNELVASETSPTIAALESLRADVRKLFKI
jgi:hypothetical protein